MMPDETLWPPLPYDAWKDTCSHLHLMSQIVGKVRLAQTPWVNHSWHVTLYVTPRGLTTGPIPHGDRIFDIAFDFIAHELDIRTSSGGERRIKLQPQSVASFHGRVMDALRELDVPVAINNRPNEIPDAIPFTEDHAERPYDAVYAARFWHALIQVDRLFNRFRTSFLGKVSPVHFFWGSFDLAVTRFSGRPAPLHPGGVPALPDTVTREAYSHEVSSAGFWPGGQGFDAAFYSYAYPEPNGFRDTAIRPTGAYFHKDLREFVLPYEAVRTASDPDSMLLDFLYSTYEAAAVTADWDRAHLECREGLARIPRSL
jgi:Family of unknown function (DUF5996)